MHTTSKQNAVIYCRVSTEEQAEKGVSLEAQQAQLLAYCELRHLEPVAIVVDAGVSAGKPLSKREGGRAVLAAVRRREVTAVVACKLDRLFRNAIDCLDVTSKWDRAGVALHLVDLGGQAVDTSTAMGRFFLTVMAAAAEMERNVTGERTKAALAHIRSQGRRYGSVAPLGHTFEERGIENDKMKYNVVEDPTEQQAVARARELSADGLSIRKVAAQLDAEGFEPRGKAWHPTTVARLLKRTKAD